MLMSSHKILQGVALVALLLAGMPAIAAATPGPDDRKAVETRGGAAPRDLRRLLSESVVLLLVPSEVAFEAASRGAQQPRGGVEFLMAREEGPGPALQPAWLEPSRMVGRGGVQADEIPLDTVTRGAVMPLRAGEQDAWKGEGVGPTGTDLP